MEKSLIKLDLNDNNNIQIIISFDLAQFGTRL